MGALNQSDVDLDRYTLRFDIDPQVYGGFLIFIAIICFCICTSVLSLILHRGLYRRVPINILICSITITDSFMILVYFCVGVLIVRSDPCKERRETVRRLELTIWDSLIGACEEFAYQNQYMHHLMLAVTRLVHFTCKEQLEKIVGFQLNTKKCYGILTGIVWGVNSAFFLLYIAAIRPEQGQFYDPAKLGWNYVGDTQSTGFTAYWNFIQSFSMVIAFGSYIAIFAIVRAKSIPIATASPHRGARKKKLEYRILLILIAMLITQGINAIYWQQFWAYMVFFPLTEMLNSVVGSILYLILVEDAACCEVSVAVLWKPRPANLSSDELGPTPTPEASL